jgi:hypothetical protein
VIHADDGYHHVGTEVEVPTSYKFMGTTDGPQTVVRAVLKSWTRPLDADPGPPLIELNLGTAAERTDSCVEATPPRPALSVRRERGGHGRDRAGPVVCSQAGPS